MGRNSQTYHYSWDTVEHANQQEEAVAIAELLNIRGSQGWQLVSTTNLTPTRVRYLFMRPANWEAPLSEIHHEMDAAACA